MGLAGALQEGRLKHEAVLVAVNDLVVVLSPAERAVDEKLRPLWPKDREARYELAGIGDEMRAGFQGQAVGLQPLLELDRPGEDPDTGALLEAIARFLTDNAGAVIQAIFEDRCRRDPQFPNLDATFVLVLEHVLKPEEVAGPAAMIVIEMREADHVIIVPVRGAEVGLEFRRQVDAPVPPVVGIAHVGVVDEHLLAVGEIEAGAIGIAERVKGQRGGHGSLLGSR